MIQFNLLPDVKLAYIKAKRIERLAITISSIAILLSIVILLVLSSIVYGIQKKSLKDLNKNIASYTSRIQNTPNLNKILTIQNQLESLPTIDAQKPAVPRMFTYIAQLTPNQADINDLKVDFGLHTINITGTADSVATINEFVDTLKFTKYKTSNSTATTDAFSNVVLSSYGIGGESGSSPSYQITANFDPTIFTSSDTVGLTVPNIISTRSEVEQPQGLFSQPTANLNNSQSGSGQ